MTARPIDATVVAPVPALRHSLFEDVFGLVTGTFVASLGLYILKSAHAVTGGTAGLSLLLSYATGWSFGLVYFLSNMPFFLLAIRAKGWNFSLRTLVSIVLVSGFGYLHPLMLPQPQLNPVYATLVGNLLAGVGMLMVFRHRSSLGGLNTLSLIVQDKLGWRAGYVQLTLDTCVILAALTVVPLGNVLVSALGAAVLNIVLALNHRPGRYLGH
ncbi:MAG: YitT family protein [Actinobacteria bacterium]|nr:YitT family protein [Actinomycetota bacterium]